MSKFALIRADGNKNIGMGHLKRASLLARMLKENFALEVKVITKEYPQTRYFFSHENINVVPIPALFSDKQEIEFLQDLVKEVRPVVFITDVLDKYNDNAYMKSIKNLGCPVVVICDESARVLIDADMIVNGNPNQLTQDYSKERGKYLVGPRYFIMDPAYATAALKKPNTDIKKVLLTFGGSDHNNLLFQVLDAFKKLNAHLSISVITSKASGYFDDLQKHLTALGITYKLHVDVPTLVSFWGQCDVAITAGGNTLFERIATRLPGATLCQLDRQMEIADTFERLGVNVNLGFGPAVSPDTLCEKIKKFIDDKELHTRQYEKAPELVDGKGLNRIEREIKLLLR